MNYHLILHYHPDHERYGLIDLLLTADEQLAMMEAERHICDVVGKAEAFAHPHPGFQADPADRP